MLAATLKQKKMVDSNEAASLNLLTKVGVSVGKVRDALVTLGSA